MNEWKNLDELASFQAAACEKPVDLTEAMSGESGSERVKKIQGTDGSRADLFLRCKAGGR